jgi:hypothetical protein
MLSKVAAEMPLSELAYNLTRVMNIVGIEPLIAAIRRHRERSFRRTCKPLLEGFDPARRTLLF